ncbi:MAG: hypothetical protein ACXVCX_02230 [Ktedonobacterales bacterium]
MGEREAISDTPSRRTVVEYRLRRRREFAARRGDNLPEYGATQYQMERGRMYNPTEILLLGMACGAAIVLCALLALWLRRQDAALSLYQQSQQGYFFGRLRLCAACTCAPALEGPRASR